MTNFEIQTATGERFKVDADDVDLGDVFVTFFKEGTEGIVACLPTRQLSYISRVQLAPNSSAS